MQATPCQEESLGQEHATASNRTSWVQTGPGPGWFWLAVSVGLHLLILWVGVEPQDLKGQSMEEKKEVIQVVQIVELTPENPPHLEASREDNTERPEVVREAAREKEEVEVVKKQAPRREKPELVPPLAKEPELPANPGATAKTKELEPLPERVPEPGPKPEPKPEPIPKPEPKPEPIPKPEPEPKPKPDLDPKPSLRLVEPPVHLEPEPKTKPKSGTISMPAAEPVLDLQSEPEPKETKGEGEEEPNTPLTQQKKGETKPPGIVKQTSPIYPRRAELRGWTGEVHLVVHLDAAGRVVSVEVTKACDYQVLNEAALQTVKTWDYSPGYQDGEPTAGTLPVIVRFVLE